MDPRPELNQRQNLITFRMPMPTKFSRRVRDLSRGQTDTQTQYLIRLYAETRR